MTAIITGDIINSKNLDTKIWLMSLKNELIKHGEEPKNWQIYRGDSFQIETNAAKALEIAISIKTAIKQYEEIDVRMAIGLGDKKYDSNKITESNGSAFINSGECFENLKKNTLALKSDNKEFDNIINIMLELALLTMDNWSPISAKFVKVSLENPKLKQSELTKILNKTQSTISEGLKRSGFDEVKKMIRYYTLKVEKLC